MNMFVIFFSLYICVTFCSGDECSFPKDSSKHDAISRLKPLMGNRYSVDDYGPDDSDDSYFYYIGICTSPREIDTANTDPIGATQISKKSKSVKALGRYDNADIKGGTSWVMLEYSEGDSYTSHCSHGKRRIVIMIICDENESKGKTRLIEENTNKSADCYYLFEIDHAAVCPKAVESSSMGTASIVFIIILVVLVLYFSIGVGYQRYVVGAKGIEQIPNFSFWRYLGNLQADGCNYICRCAFISEESKPYRPVASENIESEDDHRIDDNLLPM